VRRKSEPSFIPGGGGVAKGVGSRKETKHEETKDTNDHEEVLLSLLNFARSMPQA